VDQANLRGCEPALFHEITVSGIGRPGRHIAALCNVGDLMGVAFDVLVGEQGKRS